MRFAHFLLLAWFMFAACSVHAKESSVYVPLNAPFCMTPPHPVASFYHARSLEVGECRSRARFRSLPLHLYVVSSDERSWIDLRAGKTIWSSEDEVVYEKENQFGHFPNVGKAPAEIWINPHGVASGMIFRVTAQSPDATLSAGGVSNISRLLVLGFRESGICFLGLARSNQAARGLLAKRTSCKRMLKEELLQ